MNSPLRHRAFASLVASERRWRYRAGLVLAALALALAQAKAASAQETHRGDCVVSVLNQTANVQPDGSWTMANIPANMGPVRARVNCVDGGQSYAGASAPFLVAGSRLNGIPPVPLGTAAPTPASIALAIPQTVLSAAGQSVQTAVTASFPDGHAEDVTLASAGTIYATTNPAVASIDGDGLLTAHASGRVLVTALHEAILVSRIVTVRLGGDADEDGMPDDFELANGLDPNDPTDAFEDPDRDGLANRVEFDLGTDPRSQDTDGDGITDGEEVIPGADGFVTSPLLADTDGDGVRDRLEIQTGSDPTNPDSVNYAGALQRVVLSPASFVLVKNTVLPDEVSRRLRLMGHMLDGSTADLTARAIFASSDLLVANFGAEPGRVFAGNDGTATITAGLGGFAAVSALQVSTFAPVPLSFLPIPGFANGVVVDAGHAYIAAGVTGLQIVDVANPNAPVIVGAFDTAGNANDVAVAGNLAFVADGENGLVVLDVSNAASPLLLGRIDTAGVATEVAVRGELAFVADGANGLVVIDLSNPSAPVLRGRVDTPGNARGLDVEANLVVVADGTGGVHIVDATDAALPWIVGSVATRADGSSRAAAVAVRDGLAFVADGANLTVGGLKVIDFREPSSPVLVASAGDGFGLTALTLDRNIALATMLDAVNGVPIFDLRQLRPENRAGIDFSVQAADRRDFGTDVAARGGLVFMTGNSVPADNGVTGDSGLYIGRYSLLGDDAGIAPSARVIAPVAGVSVAERSTIVLAAQASDDVLVESVAFFVNDALVGRDFAPPYEVRAIVPTGGSTLTLRARATDFGSNFAESEPVVLNVVPDGSPTVTLEAPLDGARVTQGARFLLAARASDDVAISAVRFYRDGVLAGTDTNAPYRLELVAPAGSPQLTLRAEAVDNTGQSTQSNAVTVQVDPNQPPTVSLLAPLAGSEVVEGSRISLAAGATDDVQVASVAFFIDGIQVAVDSADPYEYTYAVPLGAATRVLQVVATDSSGLSASSLPVEITVVPDPGTTVVGRLVLADGTPVVAATVRALEVTATSSSDGTFSLAGVRTAPGPITVRASWTGPDGAYSGRSTAITPIVGGVTEVGEMVLLRVRAVGYWDTSLNRGASTQVPPILAAGLEARDVGPLQSADLSQFDILFLQNPLLHDPFWGFAYRNQRSRVFNWVAAGGALVVHDRNVVSAFAMLPGITSLRAFQSVAFTSTDLQILRPGTLVTNGPFGVLDDSSLDSATELNNMGWALASSLPEGAEAILSRTDPSQVVLFSYPFGQGRVVYSTIALDYYLSFPPPHNAMIQRLRNIYAPNVLAYALSFR